MEALQSAGAPVAGALLAPLAAVGFFTLTRWPSLIERNLLQPYGLAQRGEWHTFVTSGFIRRTARD